MPITPETASLTIAALFIASWVASALWAGQAKSSFPLRELGPLYAGGVAYFAAWGVLVASVPALQERAWPSLPAVEWLLVAVCLGACAWCWWARIHIGRLWAGGVVVREGHRVVDSGPYAVVRHPIYTGAFVLVGALALIRGRPSGLLFFVGLVTFFALKARVEERFLRQELGIAYDEYRQRVPMLVPGGPRG